MNVEHLTSETLAAMFDHTLLRASASHSELAQLCAEARQYGFGMVAINSAPVAFCREQLKGSPETYDVVHFQEKLEALRHSDPLWPVYDRRFHDVIEDQLPVTAPIVLIEGNWLLFQEGLWRKLAGQADYTIFIKAEERALKERLLQRKMTGGSTREEAEAFYQTGDGVNVRRTLQGSGPADFSMCMEADGSFSLC